MASHFVTINIFTWGYNALRHLWECNSSKLSQNRKCENTIPQNCLKGDGFENTIQQNCLKGSVLRIQLRRVASKEMFGEYNSVELPQKEVWEYNSAELPQIEMFWRIHSCRSLTEQFAGLSCGLNMNLSQLVRIKISDSTFLQGGP